MVPEFVFDSCRTANAVYSGMYDILLSDGRVTVEEYFKTCSTIGKISIDPGMRSETDNKYGWVELANVHVIELDSGLAILRMPTPIYFLAEDVHDPMVNHPSHYQSETGMEVIDVIEAFTFDLKGIEAFNTGNVLKYICRWKAKNGLQDLKKAQWYLTHLINHVEKLEEENKKI